MEGKEREEMLERMAGNKIWKKQTVFVTCEQSESECKIVLRKETTVVELPAQELKDVYILSEAQYEKLEMLRRSIAAADPTGFDVVIKDFKSQIDDILK